MKNTKHDLCADCVKLDYAALVTTATCALSLSAQRAEQYLSSITAYPPRSLTEVALNADHLREEAAVLAVVAETYAALVQGRTRSEVVIVNKQPVTPAHEG